MKDIKEIFKLTFFQLAVVYSILVVAVSTELLWKYSLQFNLFALVLAVFGAFALNDGSKKETEMKWIFALFSIGLIFALFLRSVPYFNNSVPLGYDPGIYKYIFESFERSLPNIPGAGMDAWVVGNFPPGLATLMDLFYVSGFNTRQLLTTVFVLLSSLLIFPIYLVSKRYFNKETGLLAVLLYAFSYTQLQTFWYMYYKNVVAMGLMLFSIYFMDMKEKRFSMLMIAFAAAVGFVHRPTFLVLLMVWTGYVIVNFKNKKIVRKNATEILATGFLLLIIYLPILNEIILKPLEGVFGSVVAPGTIGSGTFYSFFTYQFVSLSYLPFALLGFFFSIIRKKWNPLFLWFLINGFIVFFRIMFYNRFIIQLDVVLILMAGAGIYYGIINSIKSNKISVGIVILLLAASGFTAYDFASTASPLLNNAQLVSIEKISNLTEEDAFVMAATSYYSPWVLGYSGRKTIAPGLFDHNKWNRRQWSVFWSSGNIGEIKDLLNMYEKPLYIFIGKHPSNSMINPRKFEDNCFEQVLNDEGGILYKYLC